MGRPMPQRPEVVVRSGSSSSRSIITTATTRPILMVRRFRPGLGMSSRRGLCIRPVVSRGNVPIHKSQRTEGNQAGPSQFSRDSFRQGSRDILGQHLSDSLPPEQGGTISPSLVQEAREFFLWAENHNVHLFPQFIMGKMNVLADSLSRANQVIGSEWTLNQEVVNSLMKKWPVTVDMFATALNYRLPLYVSPLKDPQAIGTDAFLQDWDNLSMYAFPPFAIIQKVISKLRLAKNSFMTLIAPLWPQKEWFPDLLDLSVDLPVALPNRKDLLKQPHFHRFHHNLRMLQLHAWRLSGDAQRLMASLDQWLNS